MGLLPPIAVVMIDVPSCPSVENAYRMCVPNESVGAVALNPPPGTDVARSHGPCQVSNWKYTAVTGGSFDGNVVAWRLNVGVGLVVMFPESGIIVVVGGVATTCCSAMTVTTLPDA